MQHLNGPRRILSIYGLFLSLSAGSTVTVILSSPSEPGNSFLLGVSLSRLILASGLFIAFLLAVTLTVKTTKDNRWAETFLSQWFGKSRNSHVLVWLSSISFGLGWTGLFVPLYQTGRFENYWGRLQPVMLFILLASAATLTVFYVRRRKSYQANPGVIRWAIIFFLVCLSCLAASVFTKFGLAAQEDFWYGAGVPILEHQLLVAVIGGVLFLAFENKFGFKYRDLFTFILITLVTGFLWVREPLQKGFSFVGPYPPGNALYPLYDAAVFDIASQYALIGQRFAIYGVHFFERPLYLGFLVYLHALFGQDYSILMAAQAGLFAVFAALIYLIGRSLNLRAVGFAAAIVAMLRGVNSIAASNMIDTAGPKMMLTDFPAAIGVALVVLITCEWLKRPKQNWHYALWLGGVLGFSLMLRTNALMLVALIPFYAWFKFSPNWKKWLFNSFLIIVGVVAITLPWEFRNRSLGGQMYGPIVNKFLLVINTRYMPPVEPSGSILPETDESILTLKSTLALSQLYENGDVVQNEPTCNSAACFVPNHFLHNIVTSILILPTSLTMHDLTHTTRESFPYWNKDWDGTFTPISLFFVILNLFFIVLGISYAWNHHHIQGLTPLAIFMFYDLSNAFARTSGGRYIVPMDWIITIYFLLGILQMVVWFANTIGVDWKFANELNASDADTHQSNANGFSKAAIALILLIGFGSLIPLSEHLFPARYENLNPKQLLMENAQGLEANGLSISSIETFLENKNAEMLTGRALYARFFKMDQGEASFYPNLSLGYPRTTFNLIGLDGLQQGVILPSERPKYFPHASDVLVIGCKEKEYIDALAVIILDGTNTIYTRSPQSELQCPLQQPVCNNEQVCK